MPWSCRSIVLVALASVVCFSKELSGHVALLLFVGVPYFLAGDEGLFRFLARLADIQVSAGSADPQTSLCEAVVRYQEHWKAFSVHTAENDAVFLAACLKVLPRLEEGLREDLLERLRSGGLAKDFGGESRMQLPATSLAACGAAWGRWGEEELDEAQRLVFSKAKQLPLRERTVDVAEVSGALQRAEVARFDARRLLPARFFNTTLLDLHRLHSSSAGGVHIHGGALGRYGFEANQCYMTLGTLTWVLANSAQGSLFEALTRHWLGPAALAVQCPPLLPLATLAANFAAIGTVPFLHGISGKELLDTTTEYYHKHIQTLTGFVASNINVRRLPNWTRGEAGDQAIAERLGLSGEMELAHSFLWLGASAGGLHQDIQDNVLVQINGVSHVFVFPANCSSLVVDPESPVTEEWLAKQGNSMPPYFHITLRPGDGLAIPSNSRHAVVAQDARRIGMNLFFEPRHGKGRWPAAPANFYNHASEANLAVRALWLKTVAELWDTGAFGSRSFIIHGQRQEIV